jgi:hypothetical protein
LLELSKTKTRGIITLLKTKTFGKSLMTIFMDTEDWSDTLLSALKHWSKAGQPYLSRRYHRLLLEGKPFGVMIRLSGCLKNLLERTVVSPMKPHQFQVILEILQSAAKNGS